ncbi:MAG TPA: tyrosine-type recombinase/integrase, partial [Xanthobacteraceae bacterium]
TARGQRFHYFRKPGSARIRLPGLPGSHEFMQAYQAALADAPRVEIAASRTLPGTVNALIVAYYGSAEFNHMLSPATQNYRRNIIERFRAQRGDRPVKLLEQRHVVAILEQIKKPHARKSWLKALRGLMKYAVQIGMIADDPTHDIRIARPPKSEGHKTWGEPEIAAFRAKHPLGSRARLAFELLLNTSQRRGDVVRMGRQHIHSGKLSVRQSKTGVSLKIPVRPELAEAIEAAPSEHLNFLTTSHGKPFAVAGFGNWFREQCDMANLHHCSAHGLRKAAARRLAEAGCSEHEIAAITGHASLAELRVYTKAVNQGRLAEAAMAKMKA